MSGFNVVIVVVMAVVLHLQMANGQAITEGMNCKTQGEFKFCEGKSAVYNKTETAINPPNDNAGGLQSRNFGSAFSSNPIFGFLPHTRCNHNDGYKCKQLNTDISPTFLVNIRNQNRFIAQLGAVQQRVRLAICTEPRCGTGSCDQKYVTVRLLAWDPAVRGARLFTDKFRIPSCCRCSRFH